ncbi:hypothetical protein [Burkholderia vietnamiensis]|uniref:hypothetical protein n=1 Tax=Burkholderia vietnamiensis TaxID=60552 RepID=UPI001CF1696C|nr:hypothetical protein [Burkholderia vietnamiensis]MCA8448925.1 hypothetical protein [Burkholderia vietnamiensis]
MMTLTGKSLSSGRRPQHEGMRRGKPRKTFLKTFDRTAKKNLAASPLVLAMTARFESNNKGPWKPVRTELSYLDSAMLLAEKLIGPYRPDTTDQTFQAEGFFQSTAKIWDDRIACAINRLETMPLDEVAPLINQQTAYGALSFGLESNRSDVLALTIPFVDPQRLLCITAFLNDDACLNALLARLTPDVLNAKTYRQHLNQNIPHYPSHDQKACWEIVIDLDEDVPDERFLTTILPRLHAAGADLMDDRFATIEGEIHLGQFAPGRSALAHYRRQMLAAELHVLADEAVPEPAPSRARARL